MFFLISVKKCLKIVKKSIFLFLLLLFINFMLAIINLAKWQTNIFITIILKKQF